MSTPAAKWDSPSTGVFVQACVDQVLIGERQGGTFTKKGWKNIVSTFYQQIGRNYSRDQLKNKWDSLRKEWKAWVRICSETGITIDYTTNRVIADDEWWERKIEANEDYKRFRHRGMEYESLLRTLFSGQIEAGANKRAPTSTLGQPSSAGDEDVYRPTMDFASPSAADIDLSEGSGDSEDELFGVGTGPSCGMTQDMTGMALRTDPSDTGGSSAGSKRKSGTDSVQPNSRKKSKAKEISDTLSSIKQTSAERLKAFKKATSVAVPHEEVMDELMAMEEIADDVPFLAKCCEIMLDEDCRYMYRTAKKNRAVLLTWLRDKVARM